MGKAGGNRHEMTPSGRFYLAEEREISEADIANFESQLVS